jgi:hypothetical protein
MSLRIRRGTDSQRQQITPDEGELIFTTNTQKLYMGDGITQGGINIGQTLAGTGLVFDSITQTLQATGGGNQGGGGILSVSADLNPALGGNLNLNSRNITGTGNIDINGTVKATTGLGANLPLNSFNITGTGNININGTLSVTGLGADLSITGRSIIGSGNINTTGTLGVSALSKDLSLGGNTINGSGNIYITGALTATTIYANTGLGGDLLLNNYGIRDGSGRIRLLSSNTVGERLSLVTSYSVGDGQDVPSMTIKVSKGSISNPASVSVNDYLAGYSVQAYTTSNGYVGVGGLTWQIDSSADLTNVSPASNAILFTNNSNGNGNSVILNSIGNLSTSGAVIAGTLANVGYFQVGQFAGSTRYPGGASNSVAPVKGMIIFDSTTNKFIGYNGTAWVAFTGP